jgi:hypothetical protein
MAAGFPTEWFATAEPSQLEDVTCAICVCVARLPTCHRRPKVFENASNEEAALQALASLALLDDGSDDAAAAAAAAAAPRANAPSVECQALFCEVCIKQWRGKAATCPACRVHVPQHQWVVHAEAIRTVAKELQVCCPWREEGCPWTAEHLMPKGKKHSDGRQGDTLVDEHVRDECEYTPRACPHGKCTFLGTDKQLHACCWTLTPAAERQKMLANLASRTPLTLASMVHDLLPASQIKTFVLREGYVEGCFTNPNVSDVPEFYLTDLTIVRLNQGGLDYAWRTHHSFGVRNTQPCAASVTNDWVRLVTYMCECIAHAPAAYFTGDTKYLLAAPLHERTALVRALYKPQRSFLRSNGDNGGTFELALDIDSQHTEIFHGAQNELIEGGKRVWARTLVPNANIFASCKLPRIVANGLNWWMTATVSQIHVA